MNRRLMYTSVKTVLATFMERFLREGLFQCKIDAGSYRISLRSPFRINQDIVPRQAYLSQHDKPGALMIFKKFKVDTGSRPVRFNSLLYAKPSGLLHNHKQIKFLLCAFSLCKFWLALTVTLNLVIFNFSQRIFALTGSYCKSSSLRSSGLSVTIRARFCLKKFNFAHYFL